MSGSKRPSTSSLRRFITSRPYVPVAELRRRFSLDDPQAMTRIEREGVVAWIGLPEREATKLQDLWARDELGLELSVEVRAPVVVGVYPMRIARYVMDTGNGQNGHAVARHPHPGASAAPIYATNGASPTNGASGTNGASVTQAASPANGSPSTSGMSHPDREPAGDQPGL